MSKTTNKFSPEVRQRAIRMVLDHDEFLSTAVIVVLSIFLRFKGSPESKAVEAPHSETGG
nr:DUF6766 family protein [Pararhizobium arenae]